MARAELHPESTILDGARRVVTERGPRAVTIGAVASASGAPSGSIYHRFGSLDELLSRLWLRAVRRAQDAVLGVPEQDDAHAWAVSCALAMYDFCLREPEDAQLLSMFQARDFSQVALPADLRAQFDHVNDRIRQPLAILARRLAGRVSARALDLVTLAVIDLPYGAARGHTHHEPSLAPQRRKQLARAVLAALASTAAPAVPPRST